MPERLFFATDEVEFKRQMVTGFLSAYAASIYDDCCHHGEFEAIDNLPVEDAVGIADKAWEHMVGVFGMSEPASVSTTAEG